MSKDEPTNLIKTIKMIKAINNKDVITIKDTI